mmetsp:Transcript_51583/g.90068  ORF Transcript_51583/g.90068 Transcript_51583/m.90068 type:complete len:674 (-) Transcript_51583:24-2045(-)
MGATQNKPAESSESSDSEDGSTSSASEEEEEKEPHQATNTDELFATPRGKSPQKSAPKSAPKKAVPEVAKNSARSSCSSAASSNRSQNRTRSSVPTGVPQIICNCCGGGGMETGPKEYLSGSQPQVVLRQNEPSNSSNFEQEAQRGGDTASNATEAEKHSPLKLKAGKNLVSDLASLAVPKKDDDDDGTASVGGRSARSDFSMRTADVAQHSAGPPSDAAALKAAIKEFVRSMVKGRDMHLQPRVGELRPLTCCLTPETDAFLIGDRVPQRILMQEIMHVHQGLEALPLDLGYPLDQSHVVLELANATCVSFHLGHPKAAEEFILYMRLLTAMQRQKARKQAPQADNDDARSVCSDTRSVGTVQTGIMQQQLNSMPMSSMNEDPKEAKRMFKMFKETMKRGKEFYVMKQDGKMQDVECKLSSDKEVFLMRWDFQTRNIALRDMLNVLSCHQAAELRLGYPLDELCATIELQTGECLTFKFGHVEACDRFVFCMRVLVGEKRQRFVSNDLATPQQGMMSAPAAAAELGDGCLSSRSGRRGSRSARSSASEAPTNNGGPQAEVEAFVRQMVTGCKLNVVGGAGLTEVLVSMDTDLRAFQLTASDKSRRDVIVADVKAVHVGTEANKLGLDGVAIDQLCVTLELKSDDCLTFRFPDLQQRDRFALCVRIFASAHKK